MKLVPFSSEYLQLGELLPFGVRDAGGRLLLAAGQRLDDSRQLKELAAQDLFADEAEAADWMRRLNAAVDQALRANAPLGEVAALRPDPTPAREAAPAVQRTLPEAWQELTAQLGAVLREPQAGAEWRARLAGIHGRARQLHQRRPDASLYWLVHEAGEPTRRYSCHHALLSLVMAEQAAAALGWSAGWIDSLGRAALTMNVAMLKLQDQLAATEHPPTPEMRAEIDAHAQAGAQLLQAIGLDDALCVAVVRLHHDSEGDGVPLAQLAPERQLAQLLRRVDIFAAKISRRSTRAPMSPMQAARQACIGPAGVPDEVGGALLKAVGLYPPGSFVRLASGELGVVVGRGRRANLPYVAALVSGGGDVLGAPVLRDTLDPRHAVKAAVAAAAVRVRLPHERLIAMR